MFPDDLTTEVLTASLRGHNARNTAIANSIANAETPGYERMDVSFEAALAEACSRTARSSAPGPVIGEQPAAPGLTGTFDPLPPGVQVVAA